MPDNFNAFMDALEDFEEEGSRGHVPICCVTPGCDNEIMEYNLTWGYYECPICHRRVDLDEAEDYLQRVVNGEFEEE